MSAAKSAHLTLRPERCNQCGACVETCPSGAVRVGDGYILIDWHACTHCCGCVDACAPHAITREVVALRSSAKSSVDPADVGKLVVGSRAEAKAVRKAAEKAAKQAGKSSGRGFSLVPAQLRDAGAAAQPAAGAVAASPAASAGPVATVPVADAPAVDAERWAAPAATPASATRAPRRAADKPAAKAAEQPALQLGDVGWGLADVAAVLATLLVTILAKNAVLAIPAVGLMPAAGRAATRALVLAIYYGVQLGVLVFLAGRHGSALLPAFGLKASEHPERRPALPPQPALGSALLALALLVGVEVFAVGYGLTVTAAGWKQPLSLSSDVASVFGAGGAGLVLSALLVAFVAPVIEELAFRGVVLPALGARWGMWPGILVSAVLFASYHVNAWLFLPMLAFGIALGWLTWTRRAIWPAIALHVAYNGLAVAAAFLVPR